MRVALISDLHANEVALDAVLADIARAGADRLVCLGDVATLGPHPEAVLGRLRDLGCPCVLGNHDEFLLDPALIQTYTEAPPVVAAVDWCRDRLGKADRAFLHTFVRTLEIELAPGLSLGLYHGSPRSHMEDLLATTPAARVDELLAGRAHAVEAGGHTHFQMLRQHRGTLLVNPGSVGMPFKEFPPGGAPVVMAHAEYAIVDGGPAGVSVELKRVALDRGALRRAAASAPANPVAANLVTQYS